MKLKIAIVVHGRFHAFDLARALIERGHDVTLFTNYPKWAVERFGVPKDRVRSFWLHGGITRLTAKLPRAKVLGSHEAWSHPMFSRWACAELEKEHWDVVHLWSGVSEEIIRGLAGRRTLKLMMRGSAHIRAQARLLEEEERRTGKPQDRPGPWIIARERREYELADLIVTLSTFAYNSFVSEGVPPEKLVLLPLGAQLDAFRPSPEVIESRCRRIASGELLRVLYVGALSYQKGLYDLAAILKTLSGGRFRFRCVGPVAPEATETLKELHRLAEFIPKQPQHELPKWYAWGDLFIFPTVQDGYAVVLAQAHMNSLPILTTTNCGGPDLIKDDKTGWILPIRDPQAFIERLRWCDEHRKELVHMVRRIFHGLQPRDWAQVAADFEALCVARLDGRTAGAAFYGR